MKKLLYLIVSIIVATFVATINIYLSAYHGQDVTHLQTGLTFLVMTAFIYCFMISE